MDDTIELADGLRKIQERISQKFCTAVDKGRDFVEEFYREEFCQNVVPLFESLWLPQLKLLSKIGVKSQEELDAYTKARYDDKQFSEAYQKWLDVAVNWNNFLKNTIDKKLNEQYLGDLPSEIQPTSVHLTDIDSEKEVSVQDFLATPFTLFILMRFYQSTETHLRPQCIGHIIDVHNHLQDLGKMQNQLSIVIVCAGTAEGGRQWREKTGINQFPILADDKHDFLDAFRFPRSTWNTCRTQSSKEGYFNLMKRSINIDVDLMNFQEMISQWIMPDAIHDVHQMGGDVILNPAGKILYLHQAETSKDRPTSAEVFAAIRSQ